MHRRRHGCGHSRNHFSQNNNLGHDNTRGRGSSHPYNHGRGQRNKHYHAPQGNNVQPRNKGHDVETS